MNTTPSIVLPARPALLGWAVLSAALIVGFYLLTLLLAAACFYVPYLLFTRIHGGAQVFLLFLCGAVMAVTLLSSIVPRPDRFRAPGPRLEASRQPRLFIEITNLSAALGEPLPREVYLIPDVNAWVAERGGLMGIGSRRVMGLGLPLLQILTVSQFRAVLAHEFGHYYSGDTRLGPWVYKTRMAMVRALVGLGRPSTLMTAVTRAAVARLAYHVVMNILEAYWNLFLRTTQLVSRRQEYRADEIACKVAGSQSLIQGLQRIHRGSAAFGDYGKELVRVLSAGYRPPLAEGFARFLAADLVRQTLDSWVAKELAEPHTNPYDSHPPLRDRLLAAGSLPSGKQAETDPAAISLLDNVPGLEIKMLELLNPKQPIATLMPTPWEGVGADIYVLEWKEFIEPWTKLLVGITVGRLPETVKGLDEMGSHIRDPKGKLLPPKRRAEWASLLLAAAFGLALLDNGWKLSPQPGPLYFEKGADRLDPLLIVRSLAGGDLGGVDWIERAKALGIENLRLDGPHSAGAIERKQA